MSVYCAGLCDWQNSKTVIHSGADVCGDTAVRKLRTQKLNCRGFRCDYRYIACASGVIALLSSECIPRSIIALDCGPMRGRILYKPHLVTALPRGQQVARFSAHRYSKIRMQHRL